jgi:hypothetical protein
VLCSVRLYNRKFVSVSNLWGGPEDGGGAWLEKLSSTHTAAQCVPNGGYVMHLQDSTVSQLRTLQPKATPMQR